ncbi:MAG: precorrin-6A/cobalt-precorrin-6A reductase [Pseudomonadota bacterium]
MVRVLLLAGTAEARVLAGRLGALGHDVTASLAGVTARPADLSVPVRRGGFGGAAGLAAWIRARGVEALIDATHPFARQMPWNAAEAAAATGVAHLRLLRPAWPRRPGWQVFPGLGPAVAAVPPAARLLAATGSGETGIFATRPDLSIVLRSIAPVAGLPGHVQCLTARPPFSEPEERALMAAQRITHLLCRESGGEGAKLEAAEALGVQVLMIARPAQPPVPLVDTVEGAVDWFSARLDAAAERG